MTIVTLRTSTISKSPAEVASSVGVFAKLNRSAKKTAMAMWTWLRIMRVTRMVVTTPPEPSIRKRSRRYTVQEYLTMTRTDSLGGVVVGGHSRYVIALEFKQKHEDLIDIGISRSDWSSTVLTNKTVLKASSRTQCLMSCFVTCRGLLV